MDYDDSDFDSDFDRPRKSNKTIIIAVVVLVLVIIIALVLYFFVFTDDPVTGTTSSGGGQNIPPSGGGQNIPPSGGGPGTNMLLANQKLIHNQRLVAPGRELKMQDDGNFVQYTNGAVTWATHTSAMYDIKFAIFQGDGNLVLYTAAGVPRWASDTAGRGGVKLVLEGNKPVIYKADGTTVPYTGSKKN